MGTFLTSLGGKLAERWVATLLLPGAGFLLVAFCAVLLGHRHAFDAAMVVREATEFAESRSAGPRIAVLAVAVLFLSAAAGLAAQAAGRLVELVWLGPWRGPAARIGQPLITARRRRATARAAKSGVDAVPAYLPHEPTWMADRFRLLSVRIAAQYHGLHLTLVWPRLWILLAEPARAPVQTASTQFRAATILTGWGLLYTVLGVLWFPAAVAGIVTIAVGARRGRARTAAMADLMESIVDVQLGELATALNLPIGTAGVTPDLAARINDRLNKGA